jgi:hypothetical protein
MLGQLRNFIEHRLGKFITYHLRPMRSADVKRSSIAMPGLPPYAVVLRGLVVAENDFTLETLRLYAKLFPGAPLIVSTWDDTPEALLAPMRLIPGIEIVLSAHPDKPGYGHSNYQIALARTGILKAESMGAAYIIKTRTDQRMYATDLYPFLYGLLEALPLKSVGTQKKRLVALSTYTLKYRRYSLNDMFFFGTVSDLKLYWDIPFDTRDIAKKFTVGDWQDAKVCEAYFFTSFLKNIGHQIKDTYEDFWAALGSYFVIVDAQTLDWYWPKWARHEEYRNRRYDTVTLGEEINFKEWIVLQQGLGNLWPKPVGLEKLPNNASETEVKF